MKDEPVYYAGNGLSPMEAFKEGLISEEEYVGFIKGNVIKYIVRAGHKDDAIEDIMKCINYCRFLHDFYIEKMKENRLNEKLESEDDEDKGSIRRMILKGEK